MHTECTHCGRRLNEASERCACRDSAPKEKERYARREYGRGSNAYVCSVCFAGAVVSIVRDRKAVGLCRTCLDAINRVA